MNKFIKDIINKPCSDKQKKKELDKLIDEIEVAKGILSGKFRYCQDCDDYYLTKSFFSDLKTMNARICTYRDLINSDDNDYADGYVDITYSICPKGHKHEVSRKERIR